jgi:hypothetical protein
MGINLQRRNALARAFAQYPYVLEHFAKECSLKNSITGAERALTPGEECDVMRMCMAQFCVRLIKTRAQNASAAFQQFSNECTARYSDYVTKRFGVFIVQASAEYRQALLVVEQNMTNTIFEVLAAEADIIETAHQAYHKLKAEAPNEHSIPDDIKEPEDMDEGGFWHDVFLALAENQVRHHPLWIDPIQKVVLNELPSLKMALDPA